MLLYYSTSTIGWEGQEAPGRTNGKKVIDTGLKSNIGRSSNAAFMSVLNVLGFP